MRHRALFKKHWTPVAVVVLAAAGLMLWQQAARAQQPQARRVDDAVLRNAAATGEEWLS
jgi:hypothetical protein